MGSRWTTVLLGKEVASGYISVKEDGCKDTTSRPWKRLPRGSWEERQLVNYGRGNNQAGV